MSSAESFDAAQQRVKTLSRTPTPDELLELYSLYKQATVGDASGSRPGMLDFKGRAKYDAWSARKGLPKADAESAYVALVARLVARYG
jgi:acyl-CoA-binding protein